LGTGSVRLEHRRIFEERIRPTAPSTSRTNHVDELESSPARQPHPPPPSDPWPVVLPVSSPVDSSAASPPTLLSPASALVSALVPVVDDPPSAGANATSRSVRMTVVVPTLTNAR